MEDSNLEKTAISTKTECPGYTCAWNNRCLSFMDRCNGIVDCLAGDDELQCPFQPELVGASQAKSKTRKGRQDTKPEPIEPNDANKSNVDTPEKTLPTETRKTTNVPITTPQTPEALESSSTAQQTTTTTEHHTTTTEEITTEMSRATTQPSSTPFVASTTEMKRTTASSLHSTTADAVIPTTTSSTTTSTPKPPRHTTQTSIHLKPTKEAMKPIDSTSGTTDNSLSPTEDQENFGPPKKLSDRNTTIENPLPEVINSDDVFRCTTYVKQDILGDSRSTVQNTLIEFPKVVEEKSFALVKL